MIMSITYTTAFVGKISKKHEILKLRYSSSISNLWVIYFKILSILKLIEVLLFNFFNEFADVYYSSITEGHIRQKL